MEVLFLLYSKKKTINNINEYYPNILITVKKHTDVSIDFVNDNLMKKHLIYCLIATQTLMMFNQFKDGTQAERINNYLIDSFSESMGLPNNVVLGEIENYVLEANAKGGITSLTTVLCEKMGLLSPKIPLNKEESVVEVIDKLLGQFFVQINSKSVKVVRG